MTERSHIHNSIFPISPFQNWSTLADCRLTAGMASMQQQLPRWVWRQRPESVNLWETRWSWKMSQRSWSDQMHRSTGLEAVWRWSSWWEWSRWLNVLQYGCMIDQGMKSFNQWKRSWRVKWVGRVDTYGQVMVRSHGARLGQTFLTGFFRKGKNSGGSSKTCLTCIIFELEYFHGAAIISH